MNFYYFISLEGLLLSTTHCILGLSAFLVLSYLVREAIIRMVPYTVPWRNKIKIGCLKYFSFSFNFELEQSFRKFFLFSHFRNTVTTAQKGKGKI